jgi:hypothetical protein
MKRVQDLLRTVVVRTNPVFPFRYLNRGPYWLAIHAFVRLCRRFPEIRGAYLRHGMAQGDWVPGLSDIDLTVTFAGGLPIEEELGFLMRFRTAHAELRPMFPMLTHVAVLNEEHLDAWTRFGIGGQEARQWKVLLGEAPACSCDDATAAKDFLDDAICRHFEYMLAGFFKPPTYLETRGLQRVASRVLRHASAKLPETKDPALLAARVLLGIDRWIKEVEEDSPTSNLGNENQESIMIRGNVCIVVPAEPFSEESVRETLLRLRPKLLRLRDETAGGMQVWLATRRILRYWFRVSQPRQYHDWIDARIVLGTHVLSGIERPCEEEYVRSLLNMTSLILAFPQWETVILPSEPAWFAGAAFRWQVLRGWFLRLYLETGLHWRTETETQPEIERRYPDLVREFDEIRKLAVTQGCAPADVRLRGYRLLKKTAVSVHRVLAAAPVRAYAIHG